MGEKKRGGLADLEYIDLFVEHPPLADHLYTYWTKYTEIADSWKKGFESNDFPDTTIFEEIKHVAVTIGETNAQTKVKKLAKKLKLKEHEVTELFARACYKSDMEPVINFPEDLPKFQEKVN
jgi:hypothetical protein